MKLVKYIRDGKVRLGLDVTADELLKLKEKYNFISISEDDLNLIKENKEGYVGTVMSVTDDVIEDIYVGKALDTKDAWFVNKDYMKVYKSFNDTFNFCELRNLARAGVINKFARKGWNGKGMFIVYVPSSEVEIREGTPYWKAGIRGKIKIDAHFDMYTAQGTVQPGWVCSQADMNADDWVIVE